MNLRHATSLQSYQLQRQLELLYQRRDALDRAIASLERYALNRSRLRRLALQVLLEHNGRKPTSR